MFNQIRIATKSAYRNFKKNKLYGSLNLLGMGIAFGTIILVSAFVYQELSYESFHEKADRIYRPTHHISGANNFDLHFARIPVNMINELPEHMPEIEALIRFQNQEQKYVSIGEKRFTPKHAYTTDAKVFDVFSLSLVEGNPETALDGPNKVVLTASLANTYFPNESAIGKEIEVNRTYAAEKQKFQVSGIMQDLPINTHLPIDMLFSFASEEERRGWAYVYTLLKEGANIAQVEAKIPEFIQEHVTPGSDINFTFEFQALKDIHLQSHLAREITPNGQAIYIKIFLWVGIFVWLIALINFANLSTALAMARGKEVGVRKVLGAGNKSLIIFSLTEAIVYSLIALLLGLGISILCFPTFSELTGVTLWPPLAYFIPGLLLLSFLGGVLAGILPSLAMTSVQILQILKSGNSWSMRKQANKINVRRLMITLQFSATIILIGSALVAHQQFNYIQQKNIGLQKDQILAITEVPQFVKEKYQVFRQQVQDVPGVQNTSACMQVPSSAIRDMGPVRQPGADENIEPPMMDMQIIDPNFVEMMGLELVAGNDFTKAVSLKPVPEFNDTYTPANYLNESPRQYLINETAMKQLGFSDPNEALGQQVNWSIGPYTLAFGPIAGIVKDYHQETLRNEIDPVIMTVEPLWLGNFLIKVDTKNLGATLADIEQTWDKLFPYPFEYQFLDELFNQLYQQDQAQLTLLSILSFIAILISFLGVVSLIAYALESRSRELAIRRVIGADIKNLTILMGKEYFWVMGIAASIGIPVSIYFVSAWLNNFAYRVEISPFVYISAILLLFLLLILTIYWQTLRATLDNPVESLREG